MIPVACARAGTTTDILTDVDGMVVMMDPPAEAWLMLDAKTMVCPACVTSICELG